MKLFRLIRRQCLIAIIVLAALAGLPWLVASRAQTPSPQSRFEAATVKVDGTGCVGMGTNGALSSPGRLRVLCLPVRYLIELAYGTFLDGAMAQTRRLMVTGGPGSLDTDLYDIVAKAEGNASVPQLYGPLLRSLLEDRFHLHAHRETRELPVYSLTPGKSGTKLKRLSAGACTPVEWFQPLPDDGQSDSCGFQSIGRYGLRRTLDAHGIDMATLASALSGPHAKLDRPVVDKTGLTGLFEVHLKYSLDTPGASGDSDDSGLPPAVSDQTSQSIFAAIQTQLGLKLISDKGSVEVLVVDHIDRPTEN